MSLKAKSRFGFIFLVTQFSSLITHHLKYHVCLAPSLTSHHSIFFTLFVGPIPITGAAFFFFFFLSIQYPNSLNPVKKKKKRKEKKNCTANPGKEKKRKKRTKANARPKKKKKKKKIQRQPKKKKKKSKGGQKLRLWVPYVCLITKLTLSYELWKLKTAKSCFQFP